MLCGRYVRRYLKGTEDIPGDWPDRYEKRSKWSHGDHSRHLSDGSLCQCPLSLLWKKRDRIKALYFDKTGFVLLYKILDQGRFQWLCNASEVRTLTRQEYRWLLEGLSISQPKAFKHARKKEF